MNMRYGINIVVRLIFFLLPIPISKIIDILHGIGILSYNIRLDYIPLGITMALVGVVIGGILEIILPSKYLIGGKIAVQSFNMGTLSWFEGLRFSFTLDSNRKGIALTSSPS